MTKTGDRPVGVATLQEPELVVHGLRCLLSRHADRVVLLDEAAVTSADVVLHDSLADLPRTLAELDSAVADLAPVPVVTYTWNTRPELVRRALHHGAAGCLTKDLSVEKLVAALESVRRGGQVVDVGRDELRLDSVVALSPREEDVVTLITRGVDNHEIAAATFLSINSVKSHIRSAYRKMGVTSRSQAVLWGIRNGYGTADPCTEEPAAPALTG